MSTGPIPQAPAANDGFGAPVGGGFGGAPQQQHAPQQGGFGAPAGGGFGAPPQQPSQPRGAKINNDGNKLKSRDAKWNKLLWVLFFIFFVGVVLVGLQLGGIVDFKSMILGKQPAQPVPKVAPVVTPKTTTKTPPATNGEDEKAEVNAMIKDARRFIKKNKAASAKSKLETAQLLDPKNQEIYELLIKVYKATGEEAKAEKAKKKLVELGGTPPAEEAAPDAPKEEPKKEEK